MEWGLVPELATAIGGVLVVMGGAVRWIFSRMDAREARQEAKEATERAKLEKMFSDRIAHLEALVHTQGAEIERLRNENVEYLRHVGVLEGIMRASGLDVPPMIKG